MLEFDTYYHIFNHANGDDNLFREEKNYPFFLEKYHQHIDPIAKTIAWCLMPNHFHLLVKIKSEAEIASNFSSSSTFLKFGTLEKLDEIEAAKRKFLSKQFSNFFSSYSQAFNKVYNRRGSLFIKNFKRKEILNEDYLRTIIFYIHLNPIKHGFESQLQDWKWTTFKSFYTTNFDLAEYLFGTIHNFNSLHTAKQIQFESYKNLESELT
ncbi:MAG: transposase [Bacteroidia bacterium]|nr:transposase [Bacteroidia bacterium]